MTPFHTSPSSLARFHQERAGLAYAERADQFANAVERKAEGRRDAWASRARVERHATAQAVREARWATTAAFAPVLSELLDAGPWEPSDARFPAFNKLYSNSWREYRLADHTFTFRQVGARGKSTWRNSVVVMQPYVPAEELPRAIGLFLSLYDAQGLRVLALPRDWNWHAPDIEYSQMLLVGACDIVPAILL